MPHDLDSDTEYLTLGEAAKICAVSRARFEKHVKDGDITAHKFEDRPYSYFHEREVEELRSRIAEEKVIRAKERAEKAENKESVELQETRERTALATAQTGMRASTTKELEAELRERRLRRMSGASEGDVAVLVAAGALTAWLTWQLKQRTKT